MELMIEGKRARPIPGASDYYVREDGTVWSFRTKECRQIKTQKTKETSRRKSAERIRIVTDDDKKTYYYVHNVMLRAFVGERPHGAKVIWLDGNRLNNSLGNLKYSKELTGPTGPCVESYQDGHVVRMRFNGPGMPEFSMYLGIEHWEDELSDAFIFPDPDVAQVFLELRVRLDRARGELRGAAGILAFQNVRIDPSLEEIAPYFVEEFRKSIIVYGRV